MSTKAHQEQGAPRAVAILADRNRHQIVAVVGAALAGALCVVLDLHAEERSTWAIADKLLLPRRGWPRASPRARRSPIDEGGPGRRHAEAPGKPRRPGAGYRSARRGARHRRDGHWHRPRQLAEALDALDLGRRARRAVLPSRWRWRSPSRVWTTLARGVAFAIVAWKQIASLQLLARWIEGEAAEQRPVLARPAGRRGRSCSRLTQGPPPRLAGSSCSASASRLGRAASWRSSQARGTRSWP